MDILVVYEHTGLNIWLDIRVAYVTYWLHMDILVVYGHTGCIWTYWLHVNILVVY